MCTASARGGGSPCGGAAQAAWTGRRGPATSWRRRTGSSSLAPGQDWAGCSPAAGRDRYRHVTVFHRRKPKLGAPLKGVRRVTLRTDLPPGSAEPVVKKRKVHV